jgi:hypothetical protein
MAGYIPDDVTSEDVRARASELEARFPFFGYAAPNLPGHADVAAQHGVDQHTSLEKFPLAWWYRCHNLAISGKAIGGWNPDFGLLYMLAAENMPNLVHAHVTGCSIYRHRARRELFLCMRQSYPITLGSWRHSLQLMLKRFQQQVGYVRTVRHTLCHERCCRLSLRWPTIGLTGHRRSVAL